MFEAINIRDYVSGNGTDETAGFVQALAASENKTLLIEDITIKINPQFQPGNWISVQGGKRKIIASNGILKMIPPTVPRNTPGYPNTMLLFGNCSWVDISGLEIDMESLPGDAYGGTCPILFDHCDNVRFDNNYIHDNGFVGVSTQSCVDIRMTNNKIVNTDSAIFCLGGVSGLGHIRITDNFIKGGTSEGIGIFDSAQGVVNSDLAQNWVVHGNTIQNKNSYGMSISAARNGIISSNTMTGNLGGIFFFDGANAQQDGLAYGNDITVIGNRVENSEFGFNNIGSGMTVTSNTFKNISRRSMGTNDYTGEGVDTRSINVKITDNMMFNVNTDGHPTVELYKLDESVFSGNQVYNSNDAYMGIFIHQCENVLVENNYARDTRFILEKDTDFSKRNVVRNNFFHSMAIRDQTNSNVPLPATGNWILDNNILTYP